MTLIMSISFLNLGSMMSKRLVAVLIMWLVVVVAMAAVLATATASDDQQVVAPKSLDIYLYELMLYSFQKCS